MMVYTGCLISVPNEFKAGQNKYPAGIYISKSLRSDGYISITTLNGEKILFLM